MLFESEPPHESDSNVGMNDTTVIDIDALVEKQLFSAGSSASLEFEAYPSSHDLVAFQNLKETLFLFLECRVPDPLRGLC